MKTDNIMKTCCGRISAVALAALLLSPPAMADTYTLTSVDSTGLTTLKNGTYWSDGIAPSDSAAAGHQFEVTLTSGFHTPGDTIFYCDSLTFGSSSKAIPMYFKEGSWTFQDNSTGLIFVRATVSDWTPGTTTYSINGPVTFDDAWCDGQSGRYACDFSSDKSTANGIVHAFTGKVNCDSGAAVRTRLTSAADGRWYGMSFSGDLSGFYGTMESGLSGMIELGAASGTTALPGTVKASSSTSRIRLSEGSDGLSVGTLDLADGATILFSANRNAGTCQTITVADSFVQAGKVNLIMTETYTGGALDEVRYPVIVAPANTVFDETQFTCSCFGQPVRLVAGENGSGLPTLYAVRNPVVTRNSGKLYSNQAETWSDNQTPHGNADYYSGSNAGTYMRLDASTSPYISPVPLLMIANASTVMQVKDMTVSNVILKANATFENWHDGDKSTNTQYASGGTRWLRGNIDKAGYNLTFQSSLPIYFIFDCNISGGGQLVLKNVANSVYVELTGNNTFTGIQNTFNNISPSDFGGGIHVCFHDVKNLGGNPSSFVYNANIIGDYVTYKALSTTTLNRMNRGIDVEEAAFEVVDGATLTIAQKIRFASGKALHKFGAGTLCLAGELNRNLNSAPRIEVENGGIMAGSTNSFIGTTLAFSGDGHVVVDVDAIGDVAQYGIFNTTSSTPFEANDSGVIPVKLANLPDESTGVGVYPIMTVNATAASAIRGKISVAKPMKGINARVAETESADGTVTFSAVVAHTGFVMTFK